MTTNPARSFLYINAVLYLLWSLAVIVAGLFVGPHILLPGILVFAFGITALLLGSVRQYTTVTRHATLLWFGLVVASLIALGSANLRDPADYGGAIFAGVALLFIIPIPIMVCRTPVTDVDT